MFLESAMRVLVLLLALAAALPASASSFVFRGDLREGDAPAQGAHELRLTLYSHENSTVPLAGPVELSAVSVNDGRFAVDVDFGKLPEALAQGWLEVAVRGQGGDGDYVALGAREPVELKATGVCPAAWALAGNADTNVLVDFLGTTTDQPLEFRVNNLRVARFESALQGTTNVVNVLLGSRANTIDATVRGATVGGGGASNSSDALFTEVGPNRAFSHYATVGGGLRNRAGQFNDSGAFATIAGGHDNVATGTGSTIAGGYANTAGFFYSFVGGGTGNVASGTLSTIAGGSNSEASASNSTVGGGSGHIASGLSSTIAGGHQNQATGQTASVLGGSSNRATGSTSTVGGGSGNVASGSSATVSGGSNNCAGGVRSWAGGTNAKVRPASDAAVGACLNIPTSLDADGDEGSFVWADSELAAFTTTGPNQFAIRAAGGLRLANNTSQFFGADARQMLNLHNENYGIGVQGSTLYQRTNSLFAWFRDGVHSDTALDPGAGGALLMTLGTNSGTPVGVARAQSFTNVSSRHVKTAFAAVDVSAVLARVLDLPLTEWSYRSAPQQRHIGPMSQDFHAAFGLNGSDDEAIATVDADGVALAAIQGLNAKLEAEVATLREEVAALRKLVEQR